MASIHSGDAPEIFGDPLPHTHARTQRGEHIAAAVAARAGFRRSLNSRSLSLSRGGARSLSLLPPARALGVRVSLGERERERELGVEPLTPPTHRRGDDDDGDVDIDLVDGLEGGLYSWESCFRGWGLFILSMCGGKWGSIGKLRVFGAKL